MRKDVKLGLAIGGVLLAVLVVYVLVGPGSANQVGAELATGDSEAAGGAGGAGDGTGSNPANDPVAANGSGASSPEQLGSAQGDSAARQGGSDPSAGGTTPANGPPGGQANSETATADTSWNWDALVNGTQKVPSLMSNAEVRTSAGVAGNGTTNGGATANDVTANGAADVTGGAAAGTGTNDIATDPSLIARGPVTDPTATLPGASQQPAQPTVVPLNPTDTLASPSTRPSAGGRTHVVKAGETFSSIAAAAYGNLNLYPHIQRANPSVEPSRLKPGMTITLPPATEVKPAGAVATAPDRQQQKIDPRTQYRVQENDSLYNISLKLYGKSDRVEKIYEANKALIGDDMSRVKVGMILTLPEAPTQSTAAASTAQ